MKARLHLGATLVALVACGAEPGRPTLGETVQVVPSLGVNAAVDVGRSNNNLDVIVFEGRTFLAFRTAPSHFASSETKLHVLSSADLGTWRHEATFDLDTDLREPRFLSLNGTLHLYFAVLGTNPIDFEPEGTMHTRRLDDGTWATQTSVYLDGFILWRARVVHGVAQISGYTGGAEIYDFEEGPSIDVHLLTTENGVDFRALLPDGPVAMSGGVSEMDFAHTSDGALVTVGRNEAGEAQRFGSKICRAELAETTRWSCRHDFRKFDSPLLFTRDNQTFLVARRQVANDGFYDLRDTSILPQARSLKYQLSYSETPKRCAVWRVDEQTLAVEHMVDLPSRGDTCFPSALPTEGGLEVWNYSSAIDGEDLSWLEGQLMETKIYRTRVVFD